jgi:hypothetical protein
MLGLGLPDEDLVVAVRDKIAAGQSDSVLEELSRITPDGWEVVLMDEEPMPMCYEWLFGAGKPNGDEILVVMRPKTPEQIRAERKPAKR